MTAYAWTIDRDHLYEGGGFETTSAGTQGPGEAPVSMLRALDRGEGFAWRCRDDDGELYYSGRIVFGHDEGDQPPELREIREGRGYWLVAGGAPFTAGEEAGFGPLWDFAGPDAGAVAIEYRDRSGRWGVL